MLTRLKFVVLLVTLARGSDADLHDDHYENDDGYNQETQQLPPPMQSTYPPFGDSPIGRFLDRQSSFRSSPFGSSPFGSSSFGSSPFGSPRFGSSLLGPQPPSMFGTGLSSAFGGPSAIDPFTHINKVFSKLRDDHENLMKYAVTNGQNHHVQKMRQCCKILGHTDTCRDVEEGERCKPGEYLSSGMSMSSFHSYSGPLSGNGNESNSPTQKPTNVNAPTRTDSSPSTDVDDSGANHDEGDLNTLPVSGVKNKNKSNSGQQKPTNGNSPPRYGSLSPKSNIDGYDANHDEDKLGTLRAPVEKNKNKSNLVKQNLINGYAPSHSRSSPSYAADEEGNNYMDKLPLSNNGKGPKSPTKYPSNRSYSFANGRSPNAGDDDNDELLPEEEWNAGGRKKQASPTQASSKKTSPSRSGSLNAQTDYEDDLDDTDDDSESQQQSESSQKLPKLFTQKALQKQLSLLSRGYFGIDDDDNGMSGLDGFFGGRDGLNANGMPSGDDPMGSGLSNSGQPREKKIKIYEHQEPLNLSEEEVKEIRKQVFEKTNLYRSYFGLNPLEENENLNNFAQEWANKCANEGKCDHRPRDSHPYGENLYASSRVKRIGGVAVDDWFNELEHINPGDSDQVLSRKNSQIGHCTQTLWRGSQSMGVGVARSLATRMFYIVANYDPSGNVVGKYKLNLPEFKAEDIEDARKASAVSRAKFNKPRRFSVNPITGKLPTSIELQKSMENFDIGIPAKLNYAPAGQQSKNAKGSAQNNRSPNPWQRNSSGRQQRQSTMLD